MYGNIVSCINVLSEILCSIGGDDASCRLSHDLVLCIEKECPILCMYSLLKILFEVVVQRTYYVLAGASLEEFTRIVRKRSREYASFRAWMIKRLRGVDGVFKKKALRLYLEISGYLHPSIEFYQGVPLDHGLVHEIIDAIAYLHVLANRDQVARKCRMILGLLRENKYCGFDRTLNYLSKHCIDS